MPGLLMRQLQEIRATGVAYDLEESQAGVFCVAAPIFRGADVVAAVSVTRVNGKGLAPTDASETCAAAKQVGFWLDDGA
jgi:DNA-binding IclR family transcriptional regulator